MRRRPGSFRWATSLTPGLICLAAAGAAGLAAGRPPHAEAPLDGRDLADQATIRDADIELFRGRAARDPGGAFDLVRMGTLLLGRGREKGVEADLVAAERSARQALANRPERNTAGWQLLAAALFDQHRFLEAKDAADSLCARDESPASRAVLGEILLELGRYPEADRLFRPLGLRRRDPRIAPRYARWLELRGRAGEARRLLETARTDAERAGLLSAAQLAWYELRLGELALRYGAFGRARRHLDRGLLMVPDDFRLLSARARLALATGNASRAIALGNQSLLTRLDPAVLATVGDAWRSLGDSLQAAEYYGAMETAGQGPVGGFHRSWYLALLDHDRRIPDILEATRHDLGIRPDAYGFDLHAWALYKAGRRAEALAAVREAVRWGLDDPMVLEHQRIIERER